MATVRAAGRIRTALFPRRSALRRSSDRIETAALRFAVVVLLLVIPCAIVLGQRGAEDARAAADATRAIAHPVDATVLAAPAVASPAVGYTGGLSDVDVAWVEPDLTRHTASVPAAPSLETGETMRLWIGPGDRPVVPPASASDATIEGVVDAVGALVGAVLVLGSVLLALRFALDRGRMRDWDADWWTFVHRRDRGTTG
ncbi:Rv1733c family protein [Actinomycetospora sp. CA-084318]|uniref:Rv1733c family protein n=1 Tax=Actinomycetospora sp. CA-084318 TaxID=3239892 RepID=UPI003D95B29C